MQLHPISGRDDGRNEGYVHIGNLTKDCILTKLRVSNFDGDKQSGGRLRAFCQLLPPDADTGVDDYCKDVGKY